jgi:hypothetical protein
VNDFLKKTYVPENDLWGFPQEYKGVKFYPLKINETEYLNILYSIFSYPKNYIPDKQILKMSYLKFILYIVQLSISSDGNEIRDNLVKFLKHVTKNEDVAIAFISSGGPINNLDAIVIKLKIGDVVFMEHDFENIREIILEQNCIGIDYVEQYHPELEKKLQDSKQSENSGITFTDEILIFCALTRKSIFELSEYTIFQFTNQFEHLMTLQDYIMYKPLEVSGQIKMENGGEIKHYFSKNKKRGRYDSILIRKDAYINSSDIFKL